MYENEAWERAIGVLSAIDELCFLETKAIDFLRFYEGELQRCEDRMFSQLLSFKVDGQPVFISGSEAASRLSLRECEMLDFARRKQLHFCRLKSKIVLSRRSVDNAVKREAEKRRARKKPTKVTRKIKPPYRGIFKTRVEDLELSVRSANCLQNADIKLVGDLVQYTESDMLRCRNFGRKSLKEIKEILRGMGGGLSLGMTVLKQRKRARMRIAKSGRR